MSQWLCQQAESEKWSRGKSMINVVVFLLVVNLNRGRNFSIMFAVGFFVFICVVFKDFLKGLIFFFLSFTDKTNCQSKCAKTILIVKENKLMPSQKTTSWKLNLYILIYFHSFNAQVNKSYLHLRRRGLNLLFPYKISFICCIVLCITKELQNYVEVVRSAQWIL